MWWRLFFCWELTHKSDSRKFPSSPTWDFCITSSSLAPPIPSEVCSSWAFGHMGHIQTFIPTRQGLFQKDFIRVLALLPWTRVGFCSFSCVEVNWLCTFTWSWSHRWSPIGFADIWNKNEMMIWTIKGVSFSVLGSVHIYFRRWLRCPHYAGAYHVRKVTFPKIRTFGSLLQCRIRGRLCTPWGKQGS